MNDVAQCVELLKNQTKLVALLAPSFPIVYEYPAIVARLKKLGFEYVLEVSVGAKDTNRELAELLRKNPTARYITSPCAGFVRMVRAQYPRFLPFLAFQADSPMIATARIAREKYPDHRAVFLGPCVAKKLESAEDYPDLKLIVLTFKELDQIFTQFAVPEQMDATGVAFDLAAPETRIYPVDGGLTETSGVRSFLKEDEIRIVSGWKNIPAALEEFEKNPKIRLLDILFCEGGCVSGPGIVSKLMPEDRRAKVEAFVKR